MIRSILFACLLASCTEAFSPTLSKRQTATFHSASFASTAKAGAINVALTQEIGENKELTIKMEAHPLLSLVDKDTAFVEIPGGSCEKFQSNLDRVDVACFASPESVEQWLHNVDVSLGIEDGTDEEKRAAGNGNVIAACIGTETARICLESGRWQPNDIYYPKGDDDVQGWADSAVQAVADIFEKEFWGDGDAGWQ